MPTRAAAPAAGVVSDIEQQAARLHVNVRQEMEYREPSRNLFRFSAGASAFGASARPSARVRAAAPATLLPEPVAIRLSGVASEKVGELEQRTAILSTPGGVVLAHEGDDVAGHFKVGEIGEDTVDLIRLEDGIVLRLEAR